ncbi:Homoserine/homoserine lactone efflux protein [Pseudomonas savastanoi]|nr:Homoserine/homoserine lactone efflux protein [Pseudomonas savastanoi]
MALETWLGFFAACWIISLSPVASMSCGLQYGFLRGYWNALGLQIALVAQIAIVAAGLGAVLAASEMAFTLINVVRRGVPGLSGHQAMARIAC